MYLKHATRLGNISRRPRAGNKKNYIHWREITGYLAQWAVRQINHPDPTPAPPGLSKVIGYLSACIRPKFDNLGMGKFSLCEINKMLHGILMEKRYF